MRKNTMELGSIVGRGCSIYQIVGFRRGPKGGRQVCVIEVDPNGSGAYQIKSQAKKIWCAITKNGLGHMVANQSDRYSKVVGYTFSPNSLKNFNTKCVNSR